MPRNLPAKPSLEHLRAQAKELLNDIQQNVTGAIDRLRSLISFPADAKPKLADAQRAIAHEYGFTSWPKLKAHVETLSRQADPIAEFVEAVQASDTAQVEKLLTQHPQLRSRLDDPLPGFFFDGTALLAAVRLGNNAMIDLLLAAGADINQKSHWWAGGFGVLDSDHGLASYLIERGAIVDVHAATRLGMREKLEALLSANPALVHARGGDGQTPLHVAPNVEIARYLLELGADIDARDVDHESTPAQYMARDRQDVARFLVSRGCSTDILMAAALGDLALVRRHLDDDPASINTSVSERYFPKRNPRAGGTIYYWVLGGNRTAHLLAHELGHRDVLELLLERSSPEVRLAFAGEVGDEPTFRATLANFPDLPKALSNDLRRRLADAAEDSNAAAVRLMLSAGWPVDARGNLGGTALHFAAWRGNSEMVREILRYHPPLELTDTTYGGTPLGWALHGSIHSGQAETGDYPGVVAALLEAGAKPPLTDDLEASAAVKDVLRRQADVR